MSTTPQHLSLTCWSLSFLGCIGLLTVSFINYRRKSSKRIKSSITIFHFGAIIAFTLNCITAAIYQQSSNSDTHYLPLQVLSMHFWLWGCFFTYLLFIEKIKVTKDTVYASPAWVYVFAYILLALFFLFDVTEQTVVLLYGLGYIAPDKYGEYLGVCIWAIEVVDLILSVSLITVFVQKLMQATLAMGSNENHRNIQDFSLNNHQKELLTCISKVSYLSIIAISATQFMLLYWIVFQMVFYFYLGIYLTQPILHLWFHHGGYLLWAVHCFLGSLCVFLTLKQNHIWYKKCCGSCHRKCQLLCIKIAKSKTKKNYKLEERLLSETGIEQHL
eukprot:492175_1